MQIPSIDGLHRAFVESAPQPMFIKDASGRYLSANVAFLRLAGVSAEALIGRRDEDDFPADVARRLRSVLGGTSALDPKTDADPDRDVGTSRCASFPIRDALGRTIGSGGIVLPSGAAHDHGEAPAAAPFTLPPFGPTIGSFDYSFDTALQHYSSGIAQLLGIGDQPFAWPLDTWDDRIHPDDRERVQAARRRHQEEDAVMFDQQYRVRHENGSYRWIWSRGVSQRNADGRLCRVVGSMVDITAERKAVEHQHAQERLLAALARAESRFLASGNLGDAGAGILAAVAEFTASEFVQIIDVLCTPAPGSSFAVRTSLRGGQLEPVAAPPLASGKALNAATASGLPVRESAEVDRARVGHKVVLPVCQGDDVIGLFVLANRPGGYDESLLSALGPVLGTWANMLTIISARGAQHRAEDALRESEQRYRELMELSPDGVLVTQDAQVLFANQNACGILGVSSPEDIVGKRPIMRLKSEDRAIVEARVRRIEQEGFVPPYMELDVGMFDGKVKTVEFTGCRITFGGRPAVQTILRDVTQRRRDREREARSRRLESLGTLAGGVAHDFNNILTALRLNLDLVAPALSGRDEPSVALRQAVMASERAAALVRQILSFARSRPETREAVDLGALVMEVLGLVRLATPPTIELLPRIEPGLPPVMANTTQMHQVLVNLVNNAVHAIGGAAGCIRVEFLRAPDGDRDEVLVRVSDTGGGMDDHTRERIFDPFFTTKGPREGTGLGLSIVHEVVRAHGGAIDVHSRPGEGTVFELRLPAAPVPEIKAPQLQDARAADGLRVLLLDDDSMVSAVTRIGLLQSGMQVTVFDTPDVALEALREQGGRFDVAVVDLALPVMSGLDFIRQARVLRPELAMVLASGFISAETERAARELGIDEIAGKPYALPHLSSLMRRAVERQRIHS